MAGELLVQGLTFLVSLIALAKFSQYVIENALTLSRYFRIGEAVTGFVLIAVATSLPELAVSIMSSAQGEGAIAVGNVLGSNIADLAVVLGTCAIVTPLLIKRNELLEISRVLFITSIIPLVLIYTGNLDKFGGLLLVVIFAAYVYYLTKKKISLTKADNTTRPMALRAFLFFSASILGVLVSSSFAVNSTIEISEMTGLAKTFIGATLIALGTSLPELAIDLQAVRRGHYSLALGDAIGSAMTNLTLVLGLTGLINPVVLNQEILVTLMLFLLLTNMTFMHFMHTNNRLTRREGLILYGIFMIYLLAMAGVQLSVVHLLPL